MEKYEIRRKFFFHAQRECVWAKETFHISEWLYEFRNMGVVDRKFYADKAAWNYWR